MKTLGIFAIVSLMSTALFAQVRGGMVSSGSVARTGGVGSATAAQANTGVQRNIGTAVSPAGVTAQVGVPNAVTGLGTAARFGAGRQGVRPVRTGSFLYTYPVYVGGGYYDNSYAASAYANQGAPAATGQDQPNVIVVYPQQPPPVIINQYGAGDAPYGARVQPQNIYPMQPMQPAPAQAEESPAEAPHYLIAFKDHSIYSAVAYWVDGDTLHYFTTGSTHNQASVSLIDRELTARLNRDSGVEVKLPPVK
jgi:hypothetical protein